MLHAVLIAGGSGTRFWPQSRRSNPKQLLSFTGDRTLLQATVDRLSGLVPAECTWIVTSKALAAATATQLDGIPAEQILLEPQGRNTAPAIGLAAVRLLRQDPDAVMLVCPADHVIHPDHVFQDSVSRAVAYVTSHPESLLLFGAPARFASTGFGYIERGKPAGGEHPHIFHVAGFREKPDASTAAGYVKSGRFYFNCGIFVWRADAILADLKQFEPELYERLVTIEAAFGTDDWENVLEDEFPQLNSISIDYAVLERAKHVVVQPASFEWDDVGSWESLVRNITPDADGNVVDAQFCEVDTRNCIVRSTDEKHLVAAIGLEGLIVVHTPDATLIARRDDENTVKRLVALLEERGYERFL